MATPKSPSIDTAIDITEKTNDELKRVFAQRASIKIAAKGAINPPSPLKQNGAPINSTGKPMVKSSSVPNAVHVAVNSSPGGSKSFMVQRNTPSLIPSSSSASRQAVPLVGQKIVTPIVTETSSAASTTFPVRIRFSTGEQIIVRCSPGLTTQRFLQESLPKIQDLFPNVRLEQMSLATEEGTQLNDDEELASTPYIESCKKSTNIPLLLLTIAEDASDSNGNAARKTISRTLHEFPVQFLLPGGQTAVILCHGDWTIAQVKEEVRAKAGVTLRSMEFYVLKTPSVEGYINDESIQLSKLPFIDSCRVQSTTPKLILVEKSQALTKKEKMVNVEIGALIGTPLCWTFDDSEISQCRKSFTWVRYQMKKQSKPKEAEKPSNTEQTEVVEDRKFMIKLRLPLIEASLEKTVLASERETPNQFVNTMFQKYYEKRVPDKKATDFVLKVSGFADYIDGDKEFNTFEIIRNSLDRRQAVHLILLERETENDLYIEDFPDIEVLADPVIRYDHEEIKLDARPWDQMTAISIWEITKNFRVKIVGVENLKRPELEKDKNQDIAVYITAGLYHGGELVAPLMTSQLTDWSQNPRWYEWLSTNIQFCNVPRATRICFTLFARPSKGDSADIPLGWVSCQLFDYKHELRSGLMSLNLWPDDKANPIGTCVGNNSPTASPAVLFIEMDTYPLPVVFPTEPCKDLPKEALVTEINSRKPTMSQKASKLIGVQSDNIAHIDNLISRDPLYPISNTDKKILWAEREYCKTKARSLAKFLVSVAYNDRFSVQIMHRMLADWTPISTVDALELLDSKYADEKVRTYAVRCLEQISDEELSDYLLQLVQVLKYEPYHDSALARFLLRRALANRKIGHSFFWYLRSEIHVPEISERFGLILEAYLRGCGTHRAELKKQVALLKELLRCANQIKAYRDPAERKEVLHNELRKIQFPAKVQLPLNPSFETCGLTVEKCKYMDSKKLPLWLSFNNADPNGTGQYVIFKSGDDLRQDMLTLQMIRLMDKLWRAEGMNLELSPYGCLATGSEDGMIEVVLNADTCANITKTAGGAAAAFRAEPLANWLRQHNPREDQYAAAVDRFILSCAGVATYVLGIGDRHNDNVMLTKDGRLFHIDFGHFLGNYKKKFGIKRERAPFVFTPDMAYVMGGRDSKDFLKFVDMACKAYNIVRKHANVFINLFAMMLSTGIPELTEVEDIAYLRDAFSLDMSDEKAREKFKNLIYDSLATKTTQLNNAIHIWAH